MALGPGRIEIHIDELVLHGVAPGEQRAVGDAFQRELTALVTRHGVEALFAGSDAFAQQVAVPISLPQGTRPGQLGAHVGRRLSPRVLRVLIIVVGTTVAIRLLIG